MACVLAVVFPVAFVPFAGLSDCRVGTEASGVKEVGAMVLPDEVARFSRMFALAERGLLMWHGTGRRDPRQHYTSK